MNLPVPRDAGAEADRGVDLGQLGGVELAQPVEALVRQRRAADVADEAGEVADLAAGVEQPGFSAPFGP